MKNSVRDRIRVTKNGKVIRRAMGLGHSRAKRSSGNRRRKMANRSLFASDARSLLRNPAPTNII